MPRPANSCKVWTNEHARHAYLTFKNPKLTDRQKAESFSILGRSFIAVAAMVSAVDTAYEKRTTSKTNAFLNRGPWELAYIRGERDSYTPTRADLGVNGSVACGDDYWARAVQGITATKSGIDFVGGIATGGAGVSGPSGATGTDPDSGVFSDGQCTTISTLSGVNTTWTVAVGDVVVVTNGRIQSITPAGS